MSQFRVEKRRARSELALSTGVTLWGSFFLAGASATHVPERVSDLLNAEAGFLPFETASVPAETVLVNRAHILSVALLDATAEVQLDPGYSVATERRVAMVLTIVRASPRRWMRTCAPGAAHGEVRPERHSATPDVGPRPARAIGSPRRPLLDSPIHG